MNPATQCNVIGITQHTERQRAYCCIVSAYGQLTCVHSHCPSTTPACPPSHLLTATAGGEASLIDVSEAQPPTEEPALAKETTTLDTVTTGVVTKKKATKPAASEADLDDFEFWLSTTDAPAPGKAQVS